jgi:hypothetical protein
MRNLLLAALAIALPGAANGAVVINFQEVGPDVVATTSGSIDLSGLSFVLQGTSLAGIRADVALLVASAGTGDLYSTAAGPSSFGPGGLELASSGSGSFFAINGSQQVVGVPVGYVSGAALSATTTFAGRTFADLGLTAGTYVYSLPADTVTLTFGAPVPETSAWAMMLGGFALLGAASRRRTRASATYA